MLKFLPFIWIINLNMHLIFSAIGLYGCKQWGSSEAFEWSNILSWEIWYCLSKIFMCVITKNNRSLNDMSSMDTFEVLCAGTAKIILNQLNESMIYMLTGHEMNDFLSIQFRMNNFILFYKYIRWYAFTSYIVINVYFLQNVKESSMIHGFLFC